MEPKSFFALKTRFKSLFLCYFIIIIIIEKFLKGFILQSLNYLISKQQNWHKNDQKRPYLVYRLTSLKRGKRNLINEHLFNYPKDQTATFDPKLNSDRKMTEF